MKNELNILEAYLDQVLQEAGTKGIHSKWLYGADQGSIDTLATFARAADGFNTPESAEQKVSGAPEWSGFATDQGDGAGGEHKVYWKPLGGKMMVATASALLAAIAQWKPSEEPTQDQFAKEIEAAPGQQQFAAEQAEVAAEDAKMAEVEANDRQTNEEQLERMTSNLTSLGGGNTFKMERTKTSGKEEYEMSAEELATAIDSACKVPPKNSYLHVILAWTRGEENKYGFTGDVNQELLDSYDEILQLAPHIMEDDDGRYILEEDISEKQREILDASRSRADGLFLGWNRNGEASKALPKLDEAMTGITHAREEIGKPVSNSFEKYGVSNRNTKPICDGFAGVVIRSVNGEDVPLLRKTGSSKRGENSLVGTFSEDVFVGIIEFQNGRGDVGGRMSKGVTDLATALAKVDKAVRANETLWEGIVPSMVTEEESEMCEWYQRTEQLYDIYGSPNELTKALFRQRARELKALVEVAGVAPVAAWSPTKDEERQTDKQLGVKRDIVFGFATPADAQKFCKNIGLTKDYVHGTEVDLSLKTVESRSKTLNFEGATQHVALGLSPKPEKREEYKRNFENRVEYIKNTNKAIGEKLAHNMTEARDWQVDNFQKIQSALSENNTQIMPALQTIIDNAGNKNTTVAAGAQASRDLYRFQQQVQELTTKTGAERKAMATLVGRNLMALLEFQKAKSDKNYAQGAAMHDVINTVSSQESEGVVVLNNGNVSVFQGDKLMDDAIAAVIEGRAEPRELGGFNFIDEKGRKMFKTVRAPSKEGFVRVRGEVDGSYVTRNSTQVAEN